MTASVLDGRGGRGRYGLHVRERGHRRQAHRSANRR